MIFLSDQPFFTKIAYFELSGMPKRPQIMIVYFSEDIPRAFFNMRGTGGGRGLKQSIAGSFDGL